MGQLCGQTMQGGGASIFVELWKNKFENINPLKEWVPSSFF